MSMKLKDIIGRDKQNDTGLAENADSRGAEHIDVRNNLQLRKSILRIIIAVLLILAVIAAGAVLFVSIKTYYTTSKQTENYFVMADSIQNDISNNLPVLNDKFAVDRLNMFFTKDEVYSFSFSLWKYELLVNGNPVDKTAAALTVNQGDKISIRESLKETILPKEFVSIGTLTRGDANDSMKNHFALNGQTYQLTEKKEGFITTYTAENLELKKGTTFNMLFSVQLQERLGLAGDVIVVTVA